MQVDLPSAFCVIPGTFTLGSLPKLLSSSSSPSLLGFFSVLSSLPLVFDAEDDDAFFKLLLAFAAAAAAAINGDTVAFANDAKGDVVVVVVVVVVALAVVAVVLAKVDCACSFEPEGSLFPLFVAVVAALKPPNPKLLNPPKAGFIEMTFF
jgi:hypothetical protein